MPRRTLAVVGALGLAAFALSGCASDRPVHGTVTGKQFIAAYTSQVYTPVYGQRCTTTEELVNVGGHEQEEPVTTCWSYIQYWHYVPLYHPACYQLTVTGTQGGKTCVSASEYNSVQVGGKV